VRSKFGYVAQRLAILPHIEAGNSRVAARRPDQSAKHPHRGRLACAIRAQKTEDGAPLNRKREIVDSAKVAIHLSKAVEEDNRFSHGKFGKIEAMAVASALPVATAALWE
jgi:hypothetical protein